MAGAMRKMGIYLGLVEDDENRAHDPEYDDYDDYTDSSRSTHRASTDRAPARSDDRVSSYERAVPERGAADRAAARPTERHTGTDRPTARTWTTDAAAEATTYRTTAEVGGVEASPTQITTLHPRTYNEARQIGEHFRDGVPVIMNLTEMSDSDAKRLVDFAAGLSFGLRGSIERVTNKVFLLSPQNVSVTAEDKARIAEGGFFNQS